MHYYFGLSLVLFLCALFFSFSHLRTRKYAIASAFLVFFYLILSAFYIVADYFTGEGINDAVIFHLRYGLDGSGFGDYYLIILIGIGLFIVSLMASVLCFRLFTRQNLLPSSRIIRISSFFLFAAAWLVHPSLFFVYEILLKKAGYESALSREYNFLEYYHSPTIQASRDEHPNVVYIFAESFENTYFDETLFPGLVTQIPTLWPQSINFTDIHQAVGTSWTIAGMTSALCGLPLVTPSTNEHSPQGNSMSKMPTFYSGATCMSDLLHQEGYRLVYRSGSELSFAGVDKLYKTHHFDDIKGIKELKSGLKNPGYQTPWGLYDDTLLDIAFNDFKKLSKNKQKFALFLSTMDTHHPYGHVSKSCKRQSYKDGSNSMLNAVACSDELITRFIQQIQESPYGANTVIVVGSDHLSMHNMAIDELMKGKRRNQFMIIDPRTKEGKTINASGSTLDIGATLLPLLGYEAKLGLGRNLLGEEKSLIDQFSHFDKLLSAWHRDIARFWEFPKIEKEIVLDVKKKRLKLDKNSYNFPILLRISDTFEVNPFFEVKLKFFETTKLYGYLNDFLFDETFIWVDSCTRIAALEEGFTQKSKYCVAYGKLGSEMLISPLTQNKAITREDINASLQLKTLEEKAVQRRERLMQIQEK